MADNTSIEWTNATWNPITGCSVVSPGCTNCYAMRLAGGRLRNEPSRKGLTRETKVGPVWTGEVRFNEKWLDQPLRWSKPRMIFVCAHGDLFAKGVPDAWIDRIFAVMAMAPQHTFQVLTKRPARMRSYLSAIDAEFHASPDDLNERFGEHCVQITGDPCAAGWFEDHVNWPLPNVWLGVSVEDQPRADERIPILLDTTAAVRWISAEPMLGHVDLTSVLSPDSWGENNQCWRFNALEPGDEYHLLNDQGPTLNTDGPYRENCINWVVVGGESGPGARPCDIEWIRSLRDQCAGAGVPFFWKQHVVEAGRKISLPMLDGVKHDAFPEARHD